MRDPQSSCTMKTSACLHRKARMEGPRSASAAAQTRSTGGQLLEAQRSRAAAEAHAGGLGDKGTQADAL